MASLRVAAPLSPPRVKELNAQNSSRNTATAPASACFGTPASPPLLLTPEPPITASFGGCEGHCWL